MHIYIYIYIYIFIYIYLHTHNTTKYIYIYTKPAPNPKLMGNCGDRLDCLSNKETNIIYLAIVNVSKWDKVL